MSLIIVKKMKDLFKTRGLKTSDKAITALNIELEKICQKVADDVINSKLKTVKNTHIPNVNIALLNASDIN